MDHINMSNLGLIGHSHHVTKLDWLVYVFLTVTMNPTHDTILLHCCQGVSIQEIPNMRGRVLLEGCNGNSLDATSMRPNDQEAAYRAQFCDLSLP